MTQTRLSSFIESWVNVFIGFWINFFANLLILPLFGFHISLANNLLMGILYTSISVARSYCIRRWFNSYVYNATQRVEGAR